MLKPDAPIAGSTLNIYVTSQKGYLMFFSADGSLTCLDLNEPNLLHTFYDYLESLESELFYTENEAEDILRKLLK